MTPEQVIGLLDEASKTHRSSGLLVAFPDRTIQIFSSDSDRLEMLTLSMQGNGKPIAWFGIRNDEFQCGLLPDYRGQAWAMELLKLQIAQLKDKSKKQPKRSNCMKRKRKADRDGICMRPDGIYISFTDSTGARKQKKLRGVFSLTEARKLRNLELARVSEIIASGRPIATTKSFAEVTPSYLQFQKARLEPRSFERVEDIVNRILMPVFGNFDLAKIRKPDIINFMTRRAAPVQTESEQKKKKLRVPSASTIAKELNTLRHIFNWSIQQELLEHNPADNVKGPKPAKGRVRYLQPTELREVLLQCPAWLQPIAALLSFTGMRRSELLNLRYLDIDRSGERLLLPKTKNGDPRVVYLNTLALRVLDSLPRNEGRPSDCVFRDITPNHVSVEFLRAARRAGIDNFRLHDLRHTAASWLAMSGADIHLVGMLLGHRDLRMAQRYRHLNPAYLQSAARKLDTAFGPELQSLPMLQEKSHDDRTIEIQNEYKLTQAAAS